jgi:hypothetical protein
VRAALHDGLTFLGVKLDAQRNVASPSDVDIAAEECPVRVCSAKNLILLNFRIPSCCYLLESVFVMQTTQNGTSHHSMTTGNIVT